MLLWGSTCPLQGESEQGDINGKIHIICTFVSAYTYLLNKTSRHPNHFEDRFRLNAKHIHVRLRLGVVSSNRIIISIIILNK